ncbi:MULTISPECIES: sigma-54-dependent transcriptional regulator [unclassified Pseudoalteromonas]|uniref:sigma-54-dependent transcriptional regulator n=1 Tax=unclassified Pseudoalteromonas TaxID=194690 RepID=UPI001F289E35|nr:MULTISPECIES: sigma-54 dependent transcriptional regulator [unclassified Pseudoalteromonas]MCF2827893.1 sigma-54 dependent transcriptional regulator [Pseudoalteromonas sp. OF5H-5]MCF2832176.1 sigma-54 dependent transcriptional regulator [Pseudoalteromonas sp. DL2-H6]MCF2926003.1 sigma-54 dependent transcriptional regulator [Pseudoalteromonas sp. DL2-H1]MCG7555399.1 sigma-54 dependent transcriptional regulator [Pseudoalteromonas sp. Of11M-6]
MSVLVIDDNPDVIQAIKVLLLLNDIPCEGVTSPQLGLEKVRSKQFDLVIQDMNFTRDTTSGAEGKALYKAIRDLEPDLPIILLTAWTNLEMAVELIKDGAADYLAKPWKDHKLVTSVKNLLEMRELQEQVSSAANQRNARLQKLKAQYDLCGVVVADPAMLSLLEMATQVAHSDAPILITGPNGAGKEKIAEIVQANSSYKHKPFIKVNAGAIPADLIEAELFGVESGAYTGAQKSRAGRFEAADGGTLFLDEIGNLSLTGQQKLLRVLQSGEFERVGSTVTKRVNVRVISATNSNLPEAIRAGTFREDLYYRINMIELKLPPLSERKEDIAVLVDHFLPSNKSLSNAAMKQLKHHTWPGNVRELENTIGRAVLLSPRQEIECEHLAIQIPQHEEPLEYTQADIEAALDSADGVVSKAARKLGLSRQALYRRMEKFGLK